MQRGKFILHLIIEVAKIIKTSMDPECLRGSTLKGMNRTVKIIIALYKTFTNSFNIKMLISIFKA